MKARLAALGAGGVEARTFHSAALAQLHRYAPGSVGRILPTKALLLRQIANALPPPYKFRPAGDLATEIERAKARRVPPDAYLGSLGGARAADPGEPDGHGLPRVRAAQGASAARSTSRTCSSCAIRLFETDEQARADLRDRYRAFTVDEYQDVNLLQQTLLDLWLGPRDDLCVVGDDYQSIYALHRAPRPSGCSAWRRGSRTRRSCGSRRTTARRRRCSSSRTGSCRGSAAPRRCCGRRGRRAGAGAAAVRLRRRPRTRGSRASFARLAASGVPLEETAILCRTNARLADFEEVLHEAGLPFQGSSLLARDAARRLLRAARARGLDRRRGARARARARGRAGSRCCRTSSASAS